MADWTSLAGALNTGVLSAFGREVVYSPQTGQQGISFVGMRMSFCSASIWRTKDSFW